MVSAGEQFFSAKANPLQVSQSGVTMLWELLKSYQNN